MVRVPPYTHGLGRSGNEQGKIGREKYKIRIFIRVTWYYNKANMDPSRSPVPDECQCLSFTVYRGEERHPSSYSWSEVDRCGINDNERKDPEEAGRRGDGLGVQTYGVKVLGDLSVVRGGVRDRCEG